MNSRLPKYNSVRLTGPTNVARRTEPTVHVYDEGADYKYATQRHIKVTFAKFGKTPVDNQPKEK
jgi:hypothetical protein